MPKVLSNNYVKQKSVEYLITRSSRQQVTISEEYEDGQQFYPSKSKQLIQQLQNQRKNQFMNKTQLNGPSSDIQNQTRHQRNNSEPIDSRLQSPESIVNKNLFTNNFSNVLIGSQQKYDDNNRENISPTPPFHSPKHQLGSNNLQTLKQQNTRKPSQSLEANKIHTNDNFFFQSLQHLVSQKNELSGNKSLNQDLASSIPNNQKIAFAQFAQQLQMHLQDPQFVSQHKDLSQRPHNNQRQYEEGISVHNLNELMDIQDMSLSEIQKKFADSNRNYQNDKKSDSSRFDQKLFQYYSKQSKRKYPYPPSDPPKQGIEQSHSRQQKNIQQFQRLFSDSQKLPFRQQSSSSSSQWYDMMSMMINEQQKERDNQSKSLEKKNKEDRCSQWELSKQEPFKGRQSGRSSDWTNFDLTYSVDSGMTPKTSKKI